LLRTGSRATVATPHTNPATAHALPGGMAKAVVTMSTKALTRQTALIDHHSVSTNPSEPKESGLKAIRAKGV
jgi:hypothetical protein